MASAQDLPYATISSSDDSNDPISLTAGSKGPRTQSVTLVPALVCHPRPPNQVAADMATDEHLDPMSLKPTR